MSDQQPSVGRLVHYVAYGTPGVGEFPAGICRAAIVTAVDRERDDTWPEAISVCVINPTGLFFNQHIPYGETHEPGTWHWPERV